MNLENINSNQDPYSLIRSLKNQGFDCKRFNSISGTGSFLCDIIRKNYGLGIKILIENGFDMRLKDSRTGDTPLLLATAEGLCGPTSALIEHLPGKSLLDTNASGATPLKHLLTRAHSECGCIEKALAKLPLSELLVSDEWNMRENMEVTTFGSFEFTEGTKIMLVSDEPYNKHTVVLLTLHDLLSRILSNNPGRVMGVIRLWIKANLLILEEVSQKQREWNSRGFVEKVVLPVVSATAQEKAESRRYAHDLFRIFMSLISINQFDMEAMRSSLIDSLDEAKLNKETINGLLGIAYAVGRPQKLRAIVVLNIRKLLQRRFARECVTSRLSANQFYALAFINWIDELQLPTRLKNLISLDC